MAVRKIVLVKIIAILALFVAIVFFASAVVDDYKTYADSEVITAEVIDVEGTKSGMLNVKYKYSYGNRKYEESVIQSVDDIKSGDTKKIRIRKSEPKKIIQREISRAVIIDITVAFSIFTFAFAVAVLIEYMTKYYKKNGDRKICKREKMN